MANASVAVALPCNEHFDDRCTADTKSALGAYVSRIFDGQSAEFVSLLQQECVRHLGSPHEQQKTEKERAGARVWGDVCSWQSRSDVSFRLQWFRRRRSEPAKACQDGSHTFSAGGANWSELLRMHALVEVVMPVLGSGHGGIDPPMAFVGLVLAIAEVAR